MRSQRSCSDAGVFAASRTRAAAVAASLRCVVHVILVVLYCSHLLHSEIGGGAVSLFTPYVSCFLSCRFVFVRFVCFFCFPSVRQFKSVLLAGG
jgi:hypothetical protein